MAKPSPKTVERNIRRLTRELEEIDKFFYRGEEVSDRFLYAGQLERKRDDVVRSAVLQIHTALEDVLNGLIVDKMLGVTRPTRARKLRTSAGIAVRRLLYGADSLGFDMKLNLAVTLGIISARERKQLMELNTMRNKCSHNWVLRAPVRKGKRPRQKKPALLSFRGGDLHQFETLRKFCIEFGRIYYLLFLDFIEYL